MQIKRFEFDVITDHELHREGRAALSQYCKLLEIRRCEGGVRTWRSQPGEYYNFLYGGMYGGLLRNSDKSPSKLVGLVLLHRVVLSASHTNGRVMTGRISVGI
ncbi:MAG: hypothetical protein ACI90V_014002 [Bacillariaceae sp.]